LIERPAAVFPHGLQDLRTVERGANRRRELLSSRR
jgi:hypothetical protein